MGTNSVSNLTFTFSVSDRLQLKLSKILEKYNSQKVMKTFQLHVYKFRTVEWVPRKIILLSHGFIWVMYLAEISIEKEKLIIDAKIKKIKKKMSSHTEYIYYQIERLRKL